MPEYIDDITEEEFDKFIEAFAEKYRQEQMVYLQGILRQRMDQMEELRAKYANVKKKYDYKLEEIRVRRAGLTFADKETQVRQFQISQETSVHPSVPDEVSDQMEKIDLNSVQSNDTQKTGSQDENSQDTPSGYDSNIWSPATSSLSNIPESTSLNINRTRVERTESEDEVIVIDLD